MAWVLQFLVLAATAVFWWLARRDLTAKAADARAPAVEDWAKLRITVEQLMVELERRAVVAEQRIYEAEQRLRLVEQRLQASLARAEGAHGLGTTPEAPASPALPTGAFALAPERAEPGMGMPDGANNLEDAKPLPATPPLPTAVPLTAPLLLPGAGAPSLAVDMPLREAAFVDAEPAATALLIAEPPAAPALPAADPPSAQALPAAPPPSYLTPEEARYRPVYALADAGETDPAEIARQTGLPRGEVDLVLSLRTRRLS